jgi:putative Ca2+/H+ antiporter (TMEM165/GDT1 family)
MVFVAELGDKTQLAVVTQVCKYRRPWAVFAGATVGLVFVTALGAAVGQALRQLVPQNIIQTGAAAAFIAMGLLVGREALRTEMDEYWMETCDPPEDGPADSVDVGWSWAAFGSTLTLLFIAELGDKTQLAVLSLAGKHESVWAVFLGGSSALAGVTALGVAGGEGLRRLMPKQILMWLSTAAFIVMGALMASSALRNS